jgi:hypothetical protein
MLNDPNSSNVEARQGSGLAKMMESKWFGGSLVAWGALAVTIVGNAITYGFSTAATQGKIAALEYTVTRNREESLDRVKAIEANVANVYSSLSAINSIKIDIEVMKERINYIDGAIRRMERIDRRPPPGPREIR